MKRLGRIAKRAANAVMSGDVPGMRATVVAQVIATSHVPESVRAAAGAAGALVVAVEQLIGQYHPPAPEDGEGYATFDTDQEDPK